MYFGDIFSLLYLDGHPIATVRHCHTCIANKIAFLGLTQPGCERICETLAHTSLSLFPVQSYPRGGPILDPMH